MKHSDVHAQLGDYLEGDLPIAHRALVDAHIDDCSACAARLRELRATVDMLRSLAEPEPPPGLANAVLARLAAGEGQPSGLTALLERIPWRIRARLATPLIALASAAVIFLWLRHGADLPAQPVPVVLQPSIQLRKGPIGAQAPPESQDSSDAAPAGPVVPPSALAEALRDPASLLRATKDLDEAQLDARLAALAREPGSRDRVAALSQALRSMKDPRGAALADALERLGPVSDSH